VREVNYSTGDISTVSPATLDEHEADTFLEHQFVNVLSPWSSLVAP
jgi:hypothetical protein